MIWLALCLVLGMVLICGQSGSVREQSGTVWNSRGLLGGQSVSVGFVRVA